jgi:nucleoside-diphosphate-sugar epimerase
VKIDLLSPQSISHQLQEIEPDIVINLAGAFDNEIHSSLDVNEQGPRHLISAIKNLFQPPKLIHISSATEPRLREISSSFESNYSKTKYIGSQKVFDAIRDGEIQGKILRVHNCYGSRQPKNRYVAWAVERIKNGDKIELLHPERVRDFCLVDEVAARIVDVIVSASSFSDPNFEEIGSGTGMSLRTAAHEICDFLGAPSELVLESNQPAEDLHPYEVARISENSSGLCRIGFKDGLQISYGVS